MPSRTPEEILLELQPIFQEALDQPGLEVTLTSNAVNTANWDSMAHIDLIEMVERHFRVRFSLGELQDLKDVKDLVRLILDKESE